MTTSIGMQPPEMLIGKKRKKVIKVIGGDTWTVPVNLYCPTDTDQPATPENTIVTVVLSETQFDNAIWKGEWYNGIEPDKNVSGLAHISVPQSITSSLRRGSYEFTVRVSDLLKSTYVTEAEGSFLVEYTTASDQHSIPYKDGCFSEMTECIYNLEDGLEKETRERKEADAAIVANAEKTYAKASHTHGMDQVSGLSDSLSTLESSIATGDENTLSEAKSYSDEKAEDALSDAKDYALIQASSKADATLSSAKDYTDARTGSILSDAKTYSDSKDAVTLASAETYADAKTAASLDSAKTYAVERDDKTLELAKEYADSHGGKVSSVAGRTGDVVLATSDIEGLDKALEEAGKVKSVNKKTGEVTLSASDVGAADREHSHAISDVSGLQTAIDGKAAATHTHTHSGITDFSDSVKATVVDKATSASKVEHSLTAGSKKFDGSADVTVTASDIGAATSTEMESVVSSLNSKSNSTALAPEWDGSAKYALYDHVSYNGNIYKRIVAGTSSATPDTDTTNWSRVEVYDSEYRLLYEDNTMKVVENTDEAAVVWSDEYKINSTSDASLKRKAIGRLVLTDSATQVEVKFPDAEDGYMRDMLLMVTLPDTAAAISNTPMTWPSDVTYTWLGDNPFEEFDFTNSPAKYLGRTYLYMFTDMADGTMLVFRYEQKGLPTVTTKTVSPVSGATMEGTFLGSLSKVEYKLSTDTDYTALATKTVVSAHSFTADCSGLAASSTYNFRITTDNGQCVVTVTTAAS